MTAPAHPFWDYSLRFYADPETQAACLDLQDRLGADVNIVLYALYRASRGDQLDLGGLRQADQAVSAWRDDVVRPLRQVRRALKPHTHALSAADQSRVHDGIKKLELEAEQAQQYHLEGLAIAATTMSKDMAARANIATCAAYLEIDPSDPALATLLNRFETLRQTRP